MKKQVLITPIGLFTVALSIIVNITTQAAIIFTKTSSPYSIAEDFIISNNDTIIIEAGTTLVLSQNVNIKTNGVFIVNGTFEEPVSILPEIAGTGWGLIEINCPGKTSFIEHASIVDGTILSWYCDITLNHTTFLNNHILAWNIPILFVRQASVYITNSSIYSNNTGEGFQMLNSASVVVKDCYFSQAPDAIELTNVNDGNLSHNWIENNNDDGIDLNNCTNTLIDSNIIINSADRGIELGSENNGNSENIIVKRNILISCKVGVIFKENSYGQIINNTFYNNNTAVSCIENNAPKTGSDVTIQNCIFSNSIENDVFHDANSTITLSYCLSDKTNLAGDHNQQGNPLFVDPIENNFNLQENSPCINTGNPNLPKDPDNTIGDLGALFYNTDTTGINESEQLLRTIQIYPNPFENNFMISWQGPKPNYLSIELFTLDGVRILDHIQEQNSTSGFSVLVVPSIILNTDQLIICTISTYSDRYSFLLIHK